MEATNGRTGTPGEGGTLRDRLDEAFRDAESIDLTSHLRQLDTLREELMLAKVE